MSDTRSGIENDPPSAGSGEGSDHVGSVGGEPITPQRIGAAIGIAMIGTALFGSGSGHSDNFRLTPSPTRAAQSDTVLTSIFVLAARRAISRRRPWSGSSERRVRRFAAKATIVTTAWPGWGRWPRLA